MENGETTSSACLFCDKLMKSTIENYLKTANKRLDADFSANRSGAFRHRRGGGRGGGQRHKRRETKEW